MGLNKLLMGVEIKRHGIIVHWILLGFLWSSVVVLLVKMAPSVCGLPLVVMLHGVWYVCQRVAKLVHDCSNSWVS